MIEEPGTTKRQLAEDICRICGIPVPEIPGGTVPREVLAAAASLVGIQAEGKLKLQLAEEIVSRAGLAWDPEDCSSKGSTITAEGLRRVLLAIQGRSRARHGPRAVGRPFRDRPVNRASGDPRSTLVSDWDAIDRSTAHHRELENATAVALSAHLGADNVIEPVPGQDPLFDLGARLPDGRVLVVEVKSTTDVNLDQQLRLGLGQLLEYAACLEARGLEVEPLLVAGYVSPDDDHPVRRAAHRAGVHVAGIRKVDEGKMHDLQELNQVLGELIQQAERRAREKKTSS